MKPVPEVWAGELDKGVRGEGEGQRQNLILVLFVVSP